jgi:hypothetical protein
MSNFYRDQELLANQFCDAADFKTWLSEMLRSYDNAADWVEYLEDNLDIYKASGYWLDLFGLIIGQSRTVPNAVLVEFFGFSDTSYVGKGFGDGRFWGGVESITASSTLQDPEYRTVLLAKIAFNYADVSLPGLAESLSILFNTTIIGVRRDGIANIEIYIGKDLTSTEIALVNNLDLLPRAAGVSINEKKYGEPSEIFGFIESPFGFAGFDVGRFVDEF